MRKLINDLNKQLENDGIQWWYFEITKCFNNIEDGEVTLVELKNDDNGAKIRLWHSILNVEELCYAFLYRSAIYEINEFICELNSIKNICIDKQEKLLYLLE